MHPFTLSTLAALESDVIKNHAPAARQRARIEYAISCRLLFDLTAAGYSLAIDDEETTVPDTAEEFLRHLFNLDEVTLRVGKPMQRGSFIQLVFGNNGYDVISDYGTSLEPTLAPVYAWIDAAENAGEIPAFLPAALTPEIARLIEAGKAIADFWEHGTAVHAGSVQAIEFAEALKAAQL